MEGKIHELIFLPSVNSHRATTRSLAPQPDIGSAHILGRCKSIMSPCVCQSYGHFQYRVGEQLAPSKFFSVIASPSSRGYHGPFGARAAPVRYRAVGALVGLDVRRNLRYFTPVFSVAFQSFGILRVT